MFIALDNKIWKLFGLISVLFLPYVDETRLYVARHSWTHFFLLGTKVYSPGRLLCSNSFVSQSAGGNSPIPVIKTERFPLWYIFGSTLFKTVSKLYLRLTETLRVRVLRLSCTEPFSNTVFAYFCEFRASTLRVRTTNRRRGPENRLVPGKLKKMIKIT